MINNQTEIVYYSGIISQIGIGVFILFFGWSVLTIRGEQ